MVMGFINNISTGADNKTHDVGRVLGIIATIEGLALVIYSIVFRGQAFDLVQYGMGTGALFTGIGALLKLKENSEPRPPD